jgi:hypothetical protein
MIQKGWDEVAEHVTGVEELVDSRASSLPHLIEK